MPDQLISTIYDHYKDTCSIIRDAVKRRDRLLLFVIIAFGLFAFQGAFPVTSDAIINDFLRFKFGIDLKLGLSIIGNVIWFLLLIFTLRYFQLAVFVERQYHYVHKVEEMLNKGLGEGAVTREGKAYLSNYPIFSDWMWMLYTVIFPLLLLVVATAKITSELNNAYIDGWPFNIILDITAFLLLMVSIVLYLIVQHKK